ncbi:hypothetical protein EKK58_03415 [Candidatus Dependentiae bacterium]|nr:MAG: hypothetical protein EKK58_03415 [Candidatus Dependentiae bacterium]
MIYYVFLFLMTQYLTASNPFDASIIQPKKTFSKDNSFTQIKYEPILNLLKKYQIKGSFLSSNWTKTNQILYILQYFDLGAIQVFKKQERHNDFKAIQNGSCSIRKNIYEQWFLHKNSFFIKATESVALVKELYLKELNKINLLDKVHFANKYVIKALENTIVEISTETEKELLQAKESKARLENEVLSAQENKKKITAKQISELENNIKELNLKVQKLEKDILDWQSDFKNVVGYEETTTQIILKRQKDINVINEEIAKIKTNRTPLIDTISSMTDELAAYESLPKESVQEKILKTLNYIKQYNEFKTKPVNILESLVQKINVLEPKEMQTAKENIINHFKELNLPGVNVQIENIFEKDGTISNTIIEILKKYLNQKELINIINNTKETVKRLGDQKINLDKQEQSLNEKLTTIKQNTNAILAEKMPKFINTELATAEGNKSEIISQKINNKNTEIKEQKKIIISQEKKLQTLKEELSLHDTVINQTKENTSNEIKTISANIANQKLEKLKNISYVEQAKKYIDDMVTLYQNTDSKKHQKDSFSKINSMLTIANQVTVLLYDLNIILHMPIPKNITLESLEGGYSEKLDTLDSLKYKAANLQKKAENKFAAFKSALFSTRNTNISQQRSVTNTTLNPDNNLYCEIDKELFENIQAKIVAVKEDLGTMITHTLTLANSVETEYQKLLAIKNIIFIPLCNEYEQIVKITEPWLKHYKETIEPINIQNSKQEYANSISFSQSLQNPKDLLITNNDTLLIAELFFTAVSNQLSAKIKNIKTTNNEESDKNNDQFFKEVLNNILMYQLIINIIKSTQLRWYAFSKEQANKIKQAFTELNKQLVFKKTELAVALAPQIESKQNIQKDIFLNNNDNIDGQIVLKIKTILDLKKYFLQLKTLFTHKIKNHPSQPGIVKDKINEYINFIGQQKNVTQQGLVEQIAKNIYSNLLKEAQELLHFIPNHKKSTNPFE